MLLPLLQSPDDNVREKAVWVIGSIADSDTRLRDTLLAAGALQLVLPMCDPHGKASLLRQATSSLKYLFGGTPPLSDISGVLPALPVLASLLYSYDEQVLVDACWYE
jgi:importin subunit alpha-1